MTNRNLVPKFSDFHSLMPYRIQEILLISSKYDAFILQEDGQLTEQLFNTYINLNLKYAPRICRVSNGDEAIEKIENRRIDLIIIMPQLGDDNPFNLGKGIKERYPEIPLVLLAYNSKDMSSQLKLSIKNNFDKMFVWTGNSNIFLSMIKYVEDKYNVEHDVASTDVRVIIMIEDSPYYYSTFLPLFYKVIMTQTQRLMSQGLNDMHKLLRMRARPKILLVSSYEEAMITYKKYKNNVLGILSDVRYPRHGIEDPEAGFKLIKKIKKIDKYLPILLMSREIHNEEKAHKAGAQFIYKNSSKLLQDMERFVKTQFGFGDFIFRLPSGEIVGRATDLRSFVKEFAHIPIESIIFHSTYNHFSTWLMARSEFYIAAIIREQSIDFFKEPEDIRKYIISVISKFRAENQRGVITQFSMTDFESERDFTKIAGGSIGGKARGITFISNLLNMSSLQNKYPKIKIRIPETILVGTHIFDSFMENNELKSTVADEFEDDRIIELFKSGAFSEEFTQNIRLIMETVTYPIAVRSSSLLEDSHYQPFAGIYSTFMLPNNSSDINERCDQVLNAIKLVYSSIFQSKARAYLKATGHLAEDEHMGIIIQKITGKTHDKWYYPDFAGVAQSYNFFPFSHMTHDEGVAHVALGLGRTIVDDGKGLIFSPAHPEILPQFPTIDDALRNSQTSFYALDLTYNISSALHEDDSLGRLSLEDAMKHETLAPLASTFVPADNIIRDSIYFNGPKIVTFASILKFKRFPLTDILQDILELGKEGMGAPVEIEFAVNLGNKKDLKDEFTLLQIRPMVAGEEFMEVKLDSFDKNDLICFSDRVLGNGKVDDIHDIVYVMPDKFDISNSREIAREIGKINKKLNNSSFALIGMGRWGSSDPWLGIPVTWDEISNVATIVEAGIEGFNIDLSMGTHFFHNMTSLKIGYFTAPYSCRKTCLLDWEWLNSQEAEEELKYVRHLHFEKPFEIKIDGRKGTGAIFKPKP